MRWLHLLSRLGLGACLADDMGLGKTIQVLALLLALQDARRRREARQPARRAGVAAGQLDGGDRALRAGPARARRASVGDDRPPSWTRWLADRSPDVDLVITSYGSLLRAPWLAKTPWRLAVLDEAQAIKNPGAQQTRAVKQLDARARIALTGTPVENRLGDLWSIFDFLNPGLLGSGKAFTRFTKRLAERPHNPYGPLRELVRPYILRRLKTDKTVIADLPDKTEVKAFCLLSRKQAALYQQAVDDLAAAAPGGRRHPAPGPRPGVPDALQADLQPPVAVAGRRRLGARPTAASSAACARSPR